jgi:hypothetical protein
VANNIQGFTAFAEIYVVNALLKIQPGGVVPWLMPSTYFSVDIKPNNINIRSGADSSNIYGVPVTVLIDYVT